MFKVYLAGPITGLTFDGAQDWRNQVAADLGPHIQCYSPLRAKEFLRGKGVLDGSYREDVMSSDRGIMTRDHFDFQTSDLIFVNLLGSDRVSIGTVMEIAWGFAYRKPVVIAMADNGCLHDHPMIREAVGFRVNSLEAAVQTTRRVLLPIHQTTAHP